MSNSFTVKMTHTKDTKGTYVFSPVEVRDAQFISTLYVGKAAYPSAPKEIAVTVTTDE